MIIEYGDVRLSMALMYHISRKSMRDDLLEALSAYEVAEVCDAIEIPDHKRVWPNAKKAWLSFDERATHHLVMQEDITPCKNMVEGLVRALAAKPDVPITLYCRNKVIHKSLEAGHSWARIPGGVWGQAMCLPVSLIKEWLPWDERHVQPDFVHDDERLALFCVKTKRLVWATVPSLVEHRGAAQSIVGQSNRTRRATCFAGESFDALYIDWTQGIEKPYQGSGGMLKNTIKAFIE